MYNQSASEFRLFWPGLSSLAIFLLIFVPAVALIAVAREFGIWLFGLLVILLAIPITARIAYIRSVRTSYKLVPFNPNTRIRSLFSKPWWRLLVSSAAGIILSFIVVSRLLAATWQEWTTLAMTVPVLCVVYYFCLRFFKHLAAPVFQTAFSVHWACRIVTVLLLFFYGALVFTFPEFSQTVPYDQLESTSEVVGELMHYQFLMRQLEAYVLGELTTIEGWGAPATYLAVPIVVIGDVTLFFGTVSAVAFFFIPLTELRRILVSATTEIVVPRLQNVSVFWVAFAYTVFVFFAFIPALLTAELWLKEKPKVERPVCKIEIIAGKFYETGTIEKLVQVNLTSRSSQTKAIRNAINSGFDRMVENVDIFLDWHYSLPAEYMRLARLATGDFETYLQRKLQEHLETGEPFRKFQTVLNQELETEIEWNDARNEAVDKILSENLIDANEESPCDVTIEEPDLDIIYPKYQGKIEVFGDRFRDRFGNSAGAGAGAVSAVIAGALAKKLVAKGTVKLAFKAVTKAFASKAASAGGAAATGAAVGAAIGSTIPILGTAAGAVIGGVLGGLLTGVVVDAALLQLEESFGREDFKNAIIEELEKVRQETLEILESSF